MGGLSILKILAILNLAFFLVIMLFSTGNKNKLFIKFILLSSPLLSLYLIPVMTGFEMISYIFLFLFYKPKKTSFRSGVIYIVLFVILLVIVGLSLFTADSLGGEYINDIISIFPIFIFAKILIDECIEDASFFYSVILYLRILLIASLVFLCCQFVFGVEFSLAKTQNPNIVISGGFRYNSFMADPQVYAQFLAAMSFICLIKEYGATKLPMKNYILAVLALVAILSTGGRAGLLGWALGLFIVVLFGNSNYRVTVIITCIALYLIAYNFSDSFAIFKRSGDMTETYDFRAGIWQDAYAIFTDNPFFGIGLGNYAHYVSLHNPDQFWLVENEFVYFDHPESGYLKFLTELGITGFITIFLFILIPVFKGFMLYFKTWDTSIILLIAGIVAWLVGFYSTYSFGEVRIKILVVTILCLLITSHKRLAPEYEYNEETT